MMSDLWPPVVGICGWKDSGKTTLIETLIPRLLERGLRVGVVKHDAHGLEVDRPGKDTDRYYQAGAEVAAHDEHQRFTRTHLRVLADLDALVSRLGETCNLVLVEGHKASPIPKLWLIGEDEVEPPDDIEHLIGTVRPGARTVDEVLDTVLSQVEAFHKRLAVYAGVLIGGASTRMGRPKALLPWHGRTLLEHTVDVVRPWVERVVLLGTGPTAETLAEMPVLADAVGVEGPMAGLLAAMRWAPRVRWLILPCDLPHLTNQSVQWLLGQFHPGRHAVMPVLPERANPEPLGAFYDPPARLPLERAAVQDRFSLRRALPEEVVAGPSVTPDLAPAWQNVNTVEDWHRLTGEVR